MDETHQNPDGSVNFHDFLLAKDNYDCFRETSSQKRKFDFENLRITKLIGRGAYAKVYLIIHEYRTEHGALRKKEYALKVYKKELLIKNDLTEATMRERDVLLELDHNFILNLHYAFQTTNRLYFVLDLINGGDLFSQL